MKDFDQYEKEFLRKESCPVCKSDDNVAVYFNVNLGSETWYCNTPGCTYKRTDADILNSKSSNTKGDSSIQLPSYHPREHSIRGITPKTLDLYHVGIEKDGEGSLVFPYGYTGGWSVKGYKYLLPYLTDDGKKIIRCKGSVTTTDLFGIDTVPNNHRRDIILTEGEVDAMSAYELTGIPAVSIPTGAKSAEKAVRKNLEWLEQFKTVYVCFDPDDPGNEASEVVMGIIEAGIAKRVTLTEGDVNDYLNREVALKTQFKECLKHAVSKPNDKLFGKTRLRDLLNRRLTNTEVNAGMTIGIPELDSVFKWREGEVTTVFADTSVGKSTFARQVAAQYIRKGKKVLVLAFEERAEVYVERIMCMFYGINPEVMTKEKRDFLVTHLDYFLDYVEVADVSTYDPKRIHSCIEYGIRSFGASLIIFDNITACTVSADNLINATSKIYNICVELGKRFNNHSIIVSHTKRDCDLKEGEPPSLHHGYGSGNIERLGDNVLALGRTGDTMYLSIRKQRYNGFLTDVVLNFNKREYSFEGTQQQVKEKDNAKTEDEPTTSTPEQAVRQPIRTESTQGSTTVPESTKSSKTIRVRSEDNKVLQPRLSASLFKRKSVCRGKGSPRQVQSGGNEKPNTRREAKVHPVCRGLHSKISPKTEKLYQGLG